MHSVKAFQYAPGRHKQCSDGEEEGHWESARLSRRSSGKCQHTSLPLKCRNARGPGQARYASLVGETGRDLQVDTTNSTRPHLLNEAFHCWLAVRWKVES